MRRLITALVLLVGAFALIGAPSAFADTFSWSYTPGTGPDTGGSGTVTATNEGGGAFLVTGISGTWDGSSITALLAAGNYYSPGDTVPPATYTLGTCCESPANDNILFLPPGSVPGFSSGYLDLAGLGFAVGTEYVNIYGTGGAGTYLVLTGSASNENGTQTDVGGTFAITPEPATLGLLGASLILLIYVSKQRS